MPSSVVSPKRPRSSQKQTRPALTKAVPPPATGAAFSDPIEIRGARQNNLKGFDLDLPTGQLIVVTGPSGSGKSSLAFDTLYAEGQRRYVETFSPYTRQFLERMDKPRVDSIRGIPPAIAIEQANHVKSTRSTVGTITEINDYLKILLPRLAQAWCPECHARVQPCTAREVAAHAFDQMPAGASVLVTFPITVPPGEKPAQFFPFLQQQGYLRVWLDGKAVRTDEAPPASLTWLPARVPVVQDRLTLTEENRGRLFEAVETALRFGKGRASLVDAATGQATPFSSAWECPHCDTAITPPSPGLFSFNHPLGACPSCRGFGRTLGIDYDRALPDRRLSIAQGVVRPFQTGFSQDCQRDLLKAARRDDIDINVPFAELPPADQDWVLYGSSRSPDATSGPTGDELYAQGRWYGVKGYFDWLESKTYKMHVRVLLSRYRASTPCRACKGGRFQPATLNFRIPAEGHLTGLTLPQIAVLPLRDTSRIFAALPPLLDPAGAMAHGEVTTRLRYLVEVGLGYLTLDRPTRTLSGGEIERVNLTTCLGASLVNTLFVLDEPSVGLHARDLGRLVQVMRGLRDKGNTLVVVEHEEAVIRAADHLVDLGPGRGEAGGDLVYSGPLGGIGEVNRESWMVNRASRRKASTPACDDSRFTIHDSLTADYLTGKRSIPVPEQRRTPRAWLSIRGAAEHNLRDLDVDLPLGVLGVVTGVSGSGKSTLMHDVLHQNLLRRSGQDTGDAPVGRVRELSGTERLGPVVMVDQSPLARTPRSTPALYLGVWDALRERFGALDDAAASGLGPSDFSFNAGSGRCERCGGTGFEKVEMQFLSDLYLRCPECEGRRFQPHVLRVRLGGKNVHELLEMTITESLAWLNKLPGLAKREREAIRALETLAEVGLGYMRLGQPLNTLSGGESQRLKLVGHLVERQRNPSTKPALLIFDEPTTGLHFDDVAQLLRVFHRLVEAGESLLVVEHNLEVIKNADWVVDLGPEAGDEGGLLVCAGTPEDVVKCAASHTGRFLAPLLAVNREPSEARQPGCAGQSKIVNRGFSTAGDEFTPSRVAEAPPVFGSPTIHDSQSTIHLGSRRITITGAREHNLKNLTLSLPRDGMTVVTGLSGSGKSTLAFDLLFAEGQRRFLDSMSPYARQFVEQLEKPDVDRIEGLPPSVAIEQRVTRGGGKSTVGTVTEVHHFVRLLWSKLGVQHCPDCGVPAEAQTLSAIVAQADNLRQQGRLRVLAPLVRGRKGFHTDLAAWAAKKGYGQLLVDGKIMASHGFKKLERFKEHDVDVVVGEFVPSDPFVLLRDAIQNALAIGKGSARLMDAKGKFTVLSTERVCPSCTRAFDAPDPRMFSFHSPHGWCEECRGFGSIFQTESTAKRDDSVSEAERELAEERASDWVVEGTERPCPRCVGSRINSVARSVRLSAAAGETVGQFNERPVRDAAAAMARWKFPAQQEEIARDLIAEIRQRLSFMDEVGLGYLPLGRAARTLSGGETQRIRLAAQLGSNLRGVLYVLDEPTIGLHPRDNERLLGTLSALREKGNGLIVVEHDEETMRRADHILDLGPGAGRHGGEVVAQGTLAEIMLSDVSATARALRDPLRHPLRGAWRSVDDAKWLEVNGAAARNLRGFDARFAVGRLNVITGVSGSGKSTLLHTCLHPAAAEALAATKKRRKKGAPANPWREFRGAENLEAVYEVDQSPIGKTSRSTPATYVGVFDHIRELFSGVPLARMRGYTASRFSFNVAGGRCESCGGHGVIKHEMAFLPTSYTPCEDCGGGRYNAPTAEVLYNGKSIADVLRLTMAEAADFFAASPRIARPLRLLTDTGLGYLTLGQASPTLSGGESQRLKLVTELTRGAHLVQESRLRRRREAKSVLYLLEEPTVGLHLADVEKLLDVLHRLVEEGGTVVVIEHHLDVIAEADWILDIGPEAGPNGGNLVVSGPPAVVAATKESRLAPFLRGMLARKKTAR